MSIRKSMISAVLLVEMIQACGEKKAQNVVNETPVPVQDESEMSAKVEEAKAELESDKQKVQDSLRKVDSLRQVKEHGHAH